jgi:glycosyltransferase involved in cell wall biosynthesis
MKRLRLLLVAPKPPPYGGIGKWTGLLTEWLDANGKADYRVVDISPHWRAVDDLGIPHRLLGGSVQGALDICRVLAALVRFRPHVVHLTTSGSLAGLRDVTVLSMCRWFGAASVYHIRFGEVPRLRQEAGWEWRLILRAARLASRVMVLDKPTESTLQCVVAPEKVVLVPNCIGLEPLRPRNAPSDHETGRVCFVGWLLATKGVGELVDAWRVVRRRGWGLELVGPGKEAYRRQLAERLGNDGTVLPECTYREAWDKIVAADIVVLPSHTEGFPNVVLEAMAAGKAIVASRVGAIPEMLDAATSQPCGLLVEPKDVPSLAEALKRFMNDADLRSAFGKRARAKVERSYGTNDVFGRCLEIWRSLAPPGALRDADVGATGAFVPGMDALRLLLVCPKPPPFGGMGRATVCLEAWLKSRGGVAWQVVDISQRWRASDDLRILKRLIGGGIQGIGNAWQFTRKLRSFRPAVVHVSSPGGLAAVRDIVLLSLARLLNCKSVLQLHFGRLPQIIASGGWEYWLARAALRLADRVCVLDAATKRALERLLPEGKVVLLPNAIDLGRHDYRRVVRQDGPSIALYLGWVIPSKGIRELLEAWREVSPQGWELQLVGPVSERYRRQVLQHTLEGAAIRFLGPVTYDGTWELVKQADVFVLPTHTEGFPYAVLEAMTAGKAILATRVGAIPEMLALDTSEPCGLAVEPRDAHALAAALRNLLGDPGLRLELGRRARARAEKAYDARSVFEEYVLLWQELAGMGGGQPGSPPVRGEPPSRTNLTVE